MVNHMSGVQPGEPLAILHLEDAAADHELALRTLRRAQLDCRLQRVDTLAAFCQRIDSERFDLVLADYRLPGFTALDAWGHVAQRAQRPPFILLSGAIGEAAAVDAMRAGICDYLLKDQMQRLPHVIARALEVQQAHSARARAAAGLAASEQRLAELAGHLQSSIERERASIAREIHDDIGGALTAVHFDLAWILRHSSDAALREHAAAACEMLQHAIGASQRIMMNLQPPVLGQGLVAAVQWLAAGFERRTGLRTRLRCSSQTMAAAPAIELVAYRTAQEALTNIAKHAQPQSVTLELCDREQVLTLEVADDGRGMTPAMRDKPDAFGLKGLQERARTVGGWLDISSRPGQGTSVILSIPLAQCAPAAGAAA